MKRKSFLHSCIVVLQLFVTVTVLSGMAYGDDSQQTLSDKLEIQKQIMNHVRNSYVDTTMKTTILLDGAIKGMIDKLDPHSSYMPPKTVDDFTERIRGNFEGIGISFSIIDGKITIIQVIEGGPSEAAELKSRDKIVKIDGEDAVGIDQDKVKELLRGPAKSSVTVHVERPGETELLPFIITRDRVKLNSVPYALMLNPETGYLKITKFTIQTNYDVSDALRKLKDRGMKRLLLDLRSNSGGSLDAAVRVVDQFIREKNELIVETRGKRSSDNHSFFTNGDAEYADIPIVVLINHGSASASEIVAGALQDHDRALVVGQTTFGKGLVMNSIPLNRRGKELGNLVLSVAHYYTPSGRLIQRPYKNGKAEYIKEGFDDIDPNAADSSKAGKPVFYTDLGRKVYGGGGITPDRNMAPLKRLNKLESSLRNSNIFFEFADGYLLRHDDIPEDFDEFLLDYNIPEEEIFRFKQFILDKGISIDNETPFREELNKLVRKFDLSEESTGIIEDTLAENNIDLNETLFEKSIDFINREIKREIARMVWGSEERFRIWQIDDTELIGALSYFGEARELMEKRIAMVKEPDDFSPKD